MSDLQMTPDESASVLPVIEEHPQVSKTLVRGEAVVEKRWVTRNKTIRVPVTYEEIYVDGKLFGKKSKVVKKKGRAQGKAVPLFDGSLETEMVIPLFGEQITITKSMVKAGEAVIGKKRVTQNKKVVVEIEGEQVRVT
jgi:stress response protein YsnF